MIFHNNESTDKIIEGLQKPTYEHPVVKETMNEKFGWVMKQIEENKRSMNNGLIYQHPEVKEDIMPEWEEEFDEEIKVEDFLDNEPYDARGFIKIIKMFIRSIILARDQVWTDRLNKEMEEYGRGIAEARTKAIDVAIVFVKLHKREEIGETTEVALTRMYNMGIDHASEALTTQRAFIQEGLNEIMK